MRFYLLKYTKTMKTGFAGYAKGPFIFIHQDYRSDKGILAHEVEHVKQWWFGVLIFVVAGLAVFGAVGDATLGAVVAGNGLHIHSLCYGGIRPYRQWCEVVAYKKQLSVYGPKASKTFAINALADKYRLNITRQEAARLLE